MVSMPPLPSLDLKMAESSELTDLVQSYNNDVINASCALICNWAEKILKRSFNNVVEVAQFLIQQHIINPRSANAELVLSMVLSESSQSGGQKIQKQPAEGPGNKRPPSPDNSGADAAAKSKKTPPNTHPGSPPQMKKRPAEPQKPARSPQVDALVAKLPVLLPRLPAEEKFLSSSPPVRFAPPVLSSGILPRHLKLSPLPLPAGMPLTVTTGVNGTGLVSQPVAQPVISIIRPDVVSLESHSLTKNNQNGIKELAASAGTTEGRGSKRLAAEEGQPKRKRGRPRNTDVSGKGPSATVVQPPRVSTGSTTSTATKDNSTEPLHTQANFKPEFKELNIKAPALEGPQPPAHVSREPEVQETLLPRDVRETDIVPYQVSVIQDGRQSMVQWTAPTVDSRRRSTEETSSEDEPIVIKIRIE